MIALEGRWSGVELSVRWRWGTGSLRANDESGTIVVEDLVDGMRGSYDADDVERNRGPCVVDVLAGLALAAAYVAVR